MFPTPFVNPFPSPVVSLPTPIRIQKPEKARNYVNYPADNTGCYYYRMGFGEHFINLTGSGRSETTYKMIFDKNWYADVRTVKLQRQASGVQKQFAQFLASIKDEMGFKLMYEVDDVVFKEEIPDYNVFKPGFDSDEIRQNCVDIINLCDEVTVTCKFMRDLYRQKTGKKEITVVPNFMPYWWMGHQYNYGRVVNAFEKNKKKPRIVYAGSGAHFSVDGNREDDFSHVVSFIEKTRHKYQFVFIGSFPIQLKPYIDSREIEFYPFRNLLEYPTFLSRLDAQLFLAPLQDNAFNKSKSDIKYIEASLLGVPCLCQDLVTYEGALPYLKFASADELEQKVDKILNYKNRSTYFKLIPELRAIGEKRILEIPENIGSFVEALDTPYKDPGRLFLPRWQ